VKRMLAGLAFGFVAFGLQAEPPSGATTTILKPTASYEWGARSAPAASPSAQKEAVKTDLTGSYTGERPANQAPETLIPQIQRESQDFLTALSSGDVEEIKPRLLASFRKQIDDRVDLWLELRKAPFRDNGFAIRSATVGVPGTPQFINGVFVSFVPARTIARYDDGGDFRKMRIFGPRSVTLNSHLVAVSKDKGKTWKFFEADQDLAQIDKLIPETASKLVIPAKLIEATPE